MGNVGVNARKRFLNNGKPYLKDGNDPEFGSVGKKNGLNKHSYNGGKASQNKFTISIILPHKMREGIREQTRAKIVYEMQPTDVTTYNHLTSSPRVILRK